MTLLSHLPRAPRFAVPALALLLAVAGAVPASATAPQVAAMPAGTARIWFYRVFFPDDTGGMPAVTVNGRTVGYARAGYSFYRDVPAGACRITVDSYLPDPSQTMDLTLAPGTQIYLAIESDPTWIENLRGFRRGTYALGFEPPRIAAIHLQQATFGSGY
jgi:hypothetical protein